MASGVHTVSPQNVNLINEAIICNNLPKNQFHLHYFVNFQESKDYAQFSRVSDAKFTIPHETMVNYNDRLKNEQQGYGKLRDCPNSIHDDESDESCSCSSKETLDNKAGKKDTKNCQKSHIFQPNLYQPIVNYNKNNRYYFRGNQRTKRNNNNSQLIEKKVHGLMIRFQSRVAKMKINHIPQNLLDGGPWDTLNQAIWDVFANKIQKEETYINKLNLWKAIFMFFKVCLSNYGLYLVGSTMSGFALEGSDVDICLVTKPFSYEPRVDSLHHLNYLQEALLKNGLASDAELIMAKVPILKFKNKETGFNVDLNCNNIVGIQNTRLLYCYGQLDWRVRPLVVIVKIWAQANNINDAKNMTISSYSWTLMVIHYLQCGVFPPVVPCLHNLFPEEFNSQENRVMDVQGEIEGLREIESENTRSLGDLLIGFFHYYSYFNYQNYAISVRTGSRLPIEVCKQVKSPKNDPHQWKFLCIEEPFDLSNTARSVFDAQVFKHIKQVINASYKELACNKALNRILPVVSTNKQR